MAIHERPDLYQAYYDRGDLKAKIPTIDKYKMRLYQFKKRDYLCRKGTPVTHMLFIMEGRVKITQTAPNGNSLLLTYFSAGDMLGDIELVNHTTASSDVQAVTEVFCLGIDYAKYADKILSDTVFLKYLCSELGQKLQHTTKSTATNLLSKLENRLAAYILQSEQNGSFNENLSEASLYLSTSYRHLMWTLRRFVDDGILERGPAGYRILDRETLSALCDNIY